jgi:hypothetical protein
MATPITYRLRGYNCSAVDRRGPMSLWIMWRTTSDRVVVTASGRGRPFSFAASQMHYVFSVTSSLSPLWRPAPSIAGRFGPAPPSRDRVHDHSVRVGLWAVRSAKSDHRSKRDLPRPLGRGRPFFLCGVPEPRNTPQPISASLDHRVGKRRLGGIVRLKACPTTPCIDYYCLNLGSCSGTASVW